MPSGDTPVELFGFCMANSKRYPEYDANKDKYFGVYEQILNLNKESFNKLVRDNHLPGVVATGYDELWNKVSKLIYIYLKDPTNVINFLPICITPYFLLNNDIKFVNRCL